MKKTVLFTTSLVALGLVFMSVGIFRGEPADIYQKAVRICLECIGIG